MAGNGVSLVMALSTGLLCARLLGATAFGEYTVVRVSANLAISILGGGLALCASRLIALNSESDPSANRGAIATILRISLISSLGLCISVLIGAHIISDVLFGGAALADSLRIASIATFFMVLTSTLRGILNGLRHFRVLAALVAIEGLLLFASITLGAKLGGVSGAMWGLSAAAVLAAVVQFRSALKIVRPNGTSVNDSIPRGTAAQVISIAAPTMLIQAIVPICEWVARISLVRSPSGLEELAIFSVAYSWCVLIVFLPNQMVAPTIALMASRFAAGDVPGLRSTAIHTVSIATLSGVALAVLLAAGSSIIVSMYGNGFERAIDSMVWLSIAYGLGSATVVGSIFSACGKMWWQVIHYIVWGLLLCGFGLVFLDRGASGLALAYVVAYAGLFVVQMAFLLRLMKELEVATQKPRDFT